MLKFAKIGILLLALIALFGFAGTALAQEIGNYCVQDYRPGAGCTANDVRIRDMEIVTVVEPCDTGTINELEAVFRIFVSAEGSPDRYDIGLFVDLDRLPEGALSGDNCYHDYLEPPLTATPVYGDFNVDTVPDIYNLDPAFTGWLNNEPRDPADVCGDIGSNTQLFKVIQQIRVKCADRDANGLADLHTCASWDNNANTTCANLQGAFPGTNSKCGCYIVDLGIPIVTAVELASFNAAPQGGDILLTWETASELDNLGFNLYRAESVEGARNRLNAGLIPAQAPGSAVGASYEFVDATATPSTTYYYWLEDVDVSGATTVHGPISAEAASLRRLLPARPRPAATRIRHSR